MKDFQQNLLVCLALGLCGLCIYQWRAQTIQRNQIVTLNQMVYDKSAAIQGYTNSIATMDHQIAQMSTDLADLKRAAKTNEQLIVSQKRDIARWQATGEGLTNQIAEYKKAVETFETKLKEAYDGIKKQNDAMQQLATQRDEFVKKYNDSVKDRNDIVAKYNELAAQVEKLQGAKQ
jgi:chromosome segregation ATPase